MRGLRMTLSAIAASAALASLAAPASAASVLGVAWNSGCGKSTCFDQQGRFQQTWSAADAGGAMTIGQFLLDRGVLGALDGQTFNISFSIGGVEVGTWGNYNMSGIGGDELSFWGQTFVWNPEDGDLVLTLAITPPPRGGLGGFLALVSDEGGPPTNTVDPGPGGGDQGGDPGVGPQAAAVPEPRVWALMIAGFGLAGAALRRRRGLAPA